jgi:hypothetical protein
VRVEPDARARSRSRSRSPRSDSPPRSAGKSAARRVSFGKTRTVYNYFESVREREAKQAAAAPAFEAAEEVRLLNEQLVQRLAGAADDIGGEEGFRTLSNEEGAVGGAPLSPADSERLDEMQAENDEIERQLVAMRRPGPEGGASPGDDARHAVEAAAAEWQQSQLADEDSAVAAAAGAAGASRAAAAAAELDRSGEFSLPPRRRRRRLSADACDDEEQQLHEVGAMLSSSRADMLAALGLTEFDIGDGDGRAGSSPPARPSARPRITGRVV